MYFQKTLTTFRLKSLEVSSIYPFVSLEQGNCNTLAAMLFLPGKRDEKGGGRERTLFFLLFLFPSFISPEGDEMAAPRDELRGFKFSYSTFEALSNQTFTTINE